MQMKRRRLLWEALEDRRLLSVDPLAAHGLTAEYFQADDLDPSHWAVTRTDPTINFDWGIGSPDAAVTAADHFSARWSGKVTPRTSEPYIFFTHTGADDAVRLWVNQVLLVDTWSEPSDAERSGTIDLVAGQQYDVKVEYKEGVGSASLVVKWLSPSSLKEILPSELLVPAQAANNPPGLLREYWTGIPGDRIADLTSNPAYQANRPEAAQYLTDFDLPVGSGPGTGDNYGQRLRGYLTAPQTGAYTLRVAGDNDVQLLLSNDAGAENKRLMASVTGYTGYREWTKYPTQISAPVYLVAGQRYYIEALHKEGTLSDHLSVAWTLPGQPSTQWAIIAGDYLTPVRPQVALCAERSGTSEVDPQSPAPFKVTRSDDFGRDLTVQYTVGGTATNGVDYSALSGQVTIPSGQASAAITISPVDDGVIEGAENVLLRLTPSATAQYSLGEESTLTAAATICGEIPAAATDLLPANAVTTIDTRGGTSYATFVNDTVSDPSLPFTDILRVTTNTVPPNYWDVRPIWNTRAAVTQGDALLAIFWLRNADLTKETAQAKVKFELRVSPWTGASGPTITVGSQWTKYYFAFQSPRDYATGEARFDIRLGFQQQTIEIGGVQLLDCAKSVALDQLPKSMNNYGGREAEAAWRDAAEQRIEQNRKDNLTVIVKDAAGNPVQGALVHVEEVQPQFRFGSQLNTEMLSPTTAGVNYTAADRLRYRAVAEYLFSKVTNNPFYWATWLGNRVGADESVAWSNAAGLPVHAHTIVWGRLDRTPTPGWLMPQYDQIKAQQGDSAARDWLKQVILDHIQNDVGAVSGLIPGTSKPRIDEWDVINEAVAADDLWDITGDAFMVEVFQKVAQVAHPDTKLIYNDYKVITGREPPADVDQMYQIAQYLRDNNSGIDGLGFQSHFDSSSLPSVDFMHNEFTRFAGLGLPIEVTEFDVDTDSIDVQTQADFTRDYLTMILSEPAASSFIAWGFWEGAHWKSADGAAWVNYDWTVKPNGQVWIDLTKHLWNTEATGTSLADGTYSTRGFHGTYDVSASYAGLSGSMQVELAPGGSTVIVTVGQPPQLVHNQGAALAEGAAVTFTPAQLLVTDGDSTPAQLTYTLTIDPSHGTLLRNGTPLASNGPARTFSQDDVDSGRVVYQHDGVGPGTDQFTFTVQDQNGADVPAANFPITIPPVNDPPIVLGSMPTSTLVLDSGISPLRLHGLEFAGGDAPDEQLQNLTITVTGLTSAARGSVVRSSSLTPLVLGETLTVEELRGLRFNPVPGQPSSAEPFSFAVTDDGTTNGLPDPRSSSYTITLEIVHRTPISLLADLETAADSSDPGGFVDLGGIAYFTASDPLHGQELWRSDGTPQGTWLVKDIQPGTRGASIANLTVVGDRLYFTADDGTYGTELWTSDGTPAGTQIVRDGGGSFGSLVNASGTLFFAANYSYNPAPAGIGTELWKLEPQQAPLLVKDINAVGNPASSSPSRLVNAEGTVYFTANDGLHGTELWRSDGTGPGTVLVKDLNPGSSGSNITALVALGKRVFFTVTDATYGSELWTSDGTEAGTSLVKDINPGTAGSSPANLTVVGDKLFFTATDAANGNELWSTDGTEIGTAMVKDINPGASGSSPTNLTAVGSTLFLRANDGANGGELWKSNGSDSGTVLVKDIYPGTSGSSAANLTNVGGVLLFTANSPGLGTELWRSDGTGPGTVLVKDIRSGSSGAAYAQFAAVGNRLFFRSSTTSDSQELWTSDGTGPGTVEVKDIATGTSEGSNPSQLVMFGGNAYFAATTLANGTELWQTDGTTAGTAMVKDIQAGSSGSGVANLRAVGGALYFSANGGSTGGELWKSDGTAPGTALVKDINPGSSGSSPAGFVDVGGTVFFTANDGTNGTELWKTDGTDPGTVMVKDLTPGWGGSSISNMIAFGGTLLFTFNDGVHGNELWRSDGTDAGSYLVKDIYAGAVGSSPSNLAVYNGYVYFQANDPTNGVELWRTDGTAAGTVLVLNLNPMKPSSSGIPPGSSPANLTVFNSQLYFTASSQSGSELHISDGTAVNTGQLLDINPDMPGSSPRYLTVADGWLWFSAKTDALGYELYRSDGTAAGTVLVRDLRPGSASSNPTALTAAGGRMFFRANDGASGAELWLSDGTAAGTVCVEDLLPGGGDSYPQYLTNVGGKVVFRATDGLLGDELWVYSDQAPTTSGIADVAVMSNAPDTVMDLFSAFEDDVWLDSAMTYTITANTNAGLFTAVTVDPAAGTLRLDYSGTVGTAQLTVRATDRAGLWIEAPFVVTVTPVVVNPTVEYVIEISVDALHAGAAAALEATGAPNFWRLRTEGAFTENARTDYDSTVTTPNHTTIITGRSINNYTDINGVFHAGHLWGENSDDPLTADPDTHSLHHPHDAFTPVKTAWAYVPSVFDVAHDAGLRTGLYNGKHRLNLHYESYTTYGRALSAAGENDPAVSKIDAHYYQAYGGASGSSLMFGAWYNEMTSPQPLQYSFLHFAGPDSLGHGYTWDLTSGSRYLGAVQEVDGYLGQIFNLIQGDPRFAGKTAIVLTADHGGQLGSTDHGNVSALNDYRVPLYVWGPGVAPGADLYALNPQYADPGVTRPNFTDPNHQPIRNADASNLALKLLGLPAIPGSSIGASQSMVLRYDYPVQALADAPVRYWRLAESGATPTAVNIATNTTATPAEADGTYSQVPVVGVAGLLQTDAANTAVWFDGSTQSVEIPSYADVNDDGLPGTARYYTDKTIELWFKADTTAGRQVLYEQGDAVRGLNMYLLDGRLYISGWDLAEDDALGEPDTTPWGGTGSAAAAVSTPVTAGQIHHAVLVMKGDATGKNGSITGWLDGRPMGQVYGVGRLFEHAEGGSIGKQQGSTFFADLGASNTGDAYYFTGTIDDVALYNTALGAERVQLHAVQGNGTAVSYGTYSDAVLANDPVAYWPLGEGSGNGAVNIASPAMGGIGSAVDASHVGTVYSPPLVPAGSDNGAVSYSGSDSRTSIPSHTMIDGSSVSQRTVSLWFKAEDVAPRQVLYEEGDAQQGLNIYVEAGELRMGAWSNSGSSMFLHFGTPIEPNRVYHAALSLDAGSGSMVGMLDGRVFAAARGFTAVPAHSGSIGLGFMTGGSRFADGSPQGVGETGAGRNFRGSIDDLAIFNIPLSLNQIRTQLAAAGVTVPAADVYEATIEADNPLAYWRLDAQPGNGAANLAAGPVGIGPAVTGLVGTGVDRSAAGLVPLIGNQAADFSGAAGGLVTIPNHAAINTAKVTRRTIELWFNADNVTNRQVLYEEGGTSSGLNAYVEGGMVHVGAWNTSTSTMNRFLAAPVTVGTTHHLVLVFDSGDATLVGFLDGVAFGSGSGAKTLDGHSTAVAIGAMKGDSRFDDGAGGYVNETGEGRYFDGRVDEVALYNVATGSRQIQTHYAAATGQRRGLPNGATLGALVNYDAALDTTANGLWEDTIGTRKADGTAGAFDWTLTAGVTRVGPGVGGADVSGRPGINHAYVFDGAGKGSAISFEGLAGDPTNASATFEIWAKPDNFNDTDLLFETGGATNGVSVVLDHSLVKFVARCGGITGKTSTTTYDLLMLPSAEQSEFIQLVGVVDLTQKTGRLYVNGVLRDEQPAAGSGSAFNDWAGSDNSGLADVNGATNTSGFTRYEGQIAVLRIYGTALATADVANNYSAVAVGLPPTDADLAPDNVVEGQPVGTVVGNLSTMDPDIGDSYTYALVAGAGDADNSLFAVEADQLKTAAMLDYETKPFCSIRVRSTDQGGLYAEKVFAINVTDAPPVARTWDGGGSDGNWTTGANWMGGALDPLDSPVFPGAAAQSTNTNNFPADTAFGSLTLSGSGYVISGNRIVLGGGISNSIPAGQSNQLLLDVHFAAAATSVVTDGGGLTISGGISGSGVVVKTGTGALIISGPQNWGAGTVLQFGGDSGSSPIAENEWAVPSTVEQAGVGSLPDSAPAAAGSGSDDMLTLLELRSTQPATKPQVQQPAGVAVTASGPAVPVSGATAPPAMQPTGGSSVVQTTSAAHDVLLAVAVEQSGSRMTLLDEIGWLYAYEDMLAKKQEESSDNDNPTEKSVDAVLAMYWS